jgi:hypothetical protein
MVVVYNIQNLPIVIPDINKSIDDYRNMLSKFEAIEQKGNKEIFDIANCRIILKQLEMIQGNINLVNILNLIAISNWNDC